MPSNLFILPFDHRASFSRDLVGVKGKLTAAQKKKVIALKKIIFDAFLEVYEKSPEQESLAVLIDEEFGMDIIRTMKRRGITLILTTEKSGKNYYDFEYGADFKDHLKKIRPTYAKALVRFNPENREDNKRSIYNLKKLYDACRHLKIKLLIEPLVPPTEKQLKACKGSVERYDRSLRPKLTARALGQMIVHGIHPDVWKLEGMASPKDWKKVLKVTKRTPVVVLGRNAPMSQVLTWLKAGGSFPTVIGFAVGRTIFNKPLERFLDKRFTRAQAVHAIAKDFELLIRYWKHVKMHA